MTTLPIIMTTNGQKLKCSFTSIKERCDFDHISFDMEFRDIVNNSRVGTASCRIHKEHSEKKVEITITNLNATPIGNGLELLWYTPYTDGHILAILVMNSSLMG